VYQVYALVDPRDKLVYYVGITKDVQRRYIEHTLRKEKNTEKAAWITELSTLGLSPTLEILHPLLPLEEAQVQEKYWINHYLSINMPLTNKDGIDGKPLRRGMTGPRRKKEQRMIVVSAPPAVKLLTIKNIMEDTHLSWAVVNDMLRKGTIKGFKVDGQWRVHPDDYVEYINSLRNPKSKTSK